MKENMTNERFKGNFKEYMTNERFQGLFKGNFELVNYVISLGEYRIMSGQETSLDAILNEALRYPNPSHLEDLKAADEADKDE